MIRIATRLSIPCVSAAALALAAAPPLPAQDAEQGAVQSGDRIQIELFTGGGARIPELTGGRTVDRRGQIYLPFVGEVYVEGLGAGEIREKLVTQLSAFYESPVAVVTTELRVNVTGAVLRPGHYFLDPSATVIDAIAEAGGMTRTVIRGAGVVADPSEVRLTREGATRILDLRAGSVDPAVLNLRIRSGDWLHVPEVRVGSARETFQLVASWLSVAAGVTAVVFTITKN